MATIKYLEDQGYITLGKGLNGTDKEAARKLLIQTYFHTTSREEDVLLHAHAMLLNLAKLQGDDAAFRRIQGIELFRHKIELGAVYRGELSSNLVELGFSIERDGKSFKVVGVPPELVAASSKGAAKIKAQVEEWGGADTSKARQAAAMKVRAKEKPHSSFEQCAERWAAEGEEHGFTRASIAEIVTDSPAYGKHTVNAAAVISAKTSSGD
jgi:conjugative relaxase-like TrwC/TraI family protein